MNPLDVRRHALRALIRVHDDDPEEYRRLRPDLRQEIRDIMRVRLRART